MERIANSLHITLNVYTLVRTALWLVENFGKVEISYEKRGNPFHYEILLLKIAQVVQISDFFLSRGSKIAILMQYASRNVLAYLFINDDTSILSLLFIILPWTLADVVRYTFYISKNDFVTFLRYNLFIVLYPTGVFLGELRALTEFLVLHEEKNLSQNLFYLAKFNQYALYAGLPYLYWYMIQARQRYYKYKSSQKKNASQKAEPVNTTQQNKDK